MKEWSQRSPTLFCISAFVVVASSVLTLLDFSNMGVTYVKTLVFDEVPYYRKIETLSTDVRIEHFIEILGRPVFIDLLEDRHYRDLLSQFSQLNEYVFVNDYFFTQAIVSDNKVMMFSVTSRKKKFRPSIGDVVLNRTTFDQLKTTWGKPDLDHEFPVDSWEIKKPIARLFAYSRYGQDYIFARNNAGYITTKPQVNTFTVASPSIDYWKLPLSLAIGVSNERIELLDTSKP